MKTGAELKEWINKSGLSRERIAADLGISKATLHLHCRRAELPPLFQRALRDLLREISANESQQKAQHA